MTRRRKTMLFVCATVGLLYVSREWLLQEAAAFLNVSESPATADFVLVLNGGPETRPFVAAAMVNAGLTDNVLLTTASATPNTDDGILPHEHEIVSRVLVARGVSPEQIRVIPGEIASTYDEACALRRFLKSYPADRVAIVTNEFHTRRTRWVFRQVLEDVSTQLSFVAAPVDGIGSENWWKTVGGVEIYATEYCKMLYYFLCY